MLGKAKCKILKEIRQKIADENDIPYITRECTYQGDCSGTCPRCESELRYLEKELERRERFGKKVAVAALCTGITVGATGMVGCDFPGRELGGATAEPPYEEELAGAAEEEEPEPTGTEVEEPAPPYEEVETEGDVPEPVPEIIKREDEKTMSFGNIYTDPEPIIEELAGEVMPEDSGDNSCDEDARLFDPISKEAVEEAVESVQGN